jgi:hypothetical protein
MCDARWERGRMLWREITALRTGLGEGERRRELKMICLKQHHAL